MSVNKAILRYDTSWENLYNISRKYNIDIQDVGDFIDAKESLYLEHMNFAHCLFFELEEVFTCNQIAKFLSIMTDRSVAVWNMFFSTGLFCRNDNIVKNVPGRAIDFIKWGYMILLHLESMGHEIQYLKDKR